MSLSGGNSVERKVRPAGRMKKAPEWGPGLIGKVKNTKLRD
jgi:hypothetical protein